MSVAKNLKLMAKNGEIQQRTPIVIVLKCIYLQENTLFFNIK